jgi:hypothetical protein
VAEHGLDYLQVRADGQTTGREHCYSRAEYLKLTSDEIGRLALVAAVLLLPQTQQTVTRCNRSRCNIVVSNAIRTHTTMLTCGFSPVGRRRRQRARSCIPYGAALTPFGECCIRCNSAHFGQRGCAVPEVVQPDRRQVLAANQPDELAGDLLGSDWPPVGPGEHVPISAGGRMCTAVPGQDIERPWIQGQDSVAGYALRRQRDQPAAVILQLAADGEGRVAGVDVGPAQSGGLAAGRSRPSAGSRRTRAHC